MLLSSDQSLGMIMVMLVFSGCMTEHTKYDFLLLGNPFVGSQLQYVIGREGVSLNLLQGGLQSSGEQISKSYHLMISVGLEDVGGHLSAKFP